MPKIISHAILLDDLILSFVPHSSLQLMDLEGHRVPPLKFLRAFNSVQFSNCPLTQGIFEPIQFSE
jgi:hypothetical protein